MYFKGPRTPLSNLFVVSGGLHVWNNNFRSSEHAYQWRKAQIAGDHYRMQKIKDSISPFSAMRIGRQVETSTQWYNERESYMWELLQAKAAQCPEFRYTLASTGVRSLVENTNNHYWGRGSDGSGENRLGYLLERLRASLL